MGASVHDHNHIPAWSESLASLRAERAELTAVCTKCASRPASLEKLFAAKGPHFTLWNKTFPCPRPLCPGRVWFYACRPGANTWPTMMRNAYPNSLAEVEAKLQTLRERDAGPPTEYDGG
jgi:hypothetical protein